MATLLHRALRAPALAAVLLLSAPGLALADAAPPAPCPFGALHVAGVQRYQVREAHGRAVFNVTRGASLVVPAQPGLTREWVHALTARHIAAMAKADMSGCPFEVAGVSVSVESSGGAFRVNVIGRTATEGERIFRLAARMRAGQ